MPRELERPDTHVRCPLCHTSLADEPEVYRCPDCDTGYHDVCARELNGCATLGCASLGAGHRFELSQERREEIRRELAGELRHRARRVRGPVLCEIPGCTRELDTAPASPPAAWLSDLLVRASRRLGLSFYCEFHVSRVLAVPVGAACMVAIALAMPLFVPASGNVDEAFRYFLGGAGAFLLLLWLQFRLSQRERAPHSEPAAPACDARERRRAEPKPAKLA